MLKKKSKHFQPQHLAPIGISFPFPYLSDNGKILTLAGFDAPAQTLRDPDSFFPLADLNRTIARVRVFFFPSFFGCCAFFMK